MTTVSIKCIGSVKGNPLVKAVNKCPNEATAPPAIGLINKAAKNPGMESKAMVPCILIIAPIAESQINNPLLVIT